MTSAHIIFIPTVLSVGVIIGFVLGTRAAKNQLAIEQRRDAERERVRAERAARKSAQ